MRRLSMDIVTEEGDTLQSVAQALDMTLDEFVSFNPYIRQYMGRNQYITHIRLCRTIERGIRVCSYKSDDEIL